MNVLMPQLGETVAEGTVAAWHKKQGDAVEKDEALLDVETDKAATEVPAPVSGVVASVLVPEGQTVEVGTVLAVIEVAGASESAAFPDESSRRGAAQQAPQPRRSKPAGKRSGRTNARGGSKGGRARLSPVVRRLLAEHGLDPQDISGSGRDGRITREDVLAVVQRRAEATYEPAVAGGAGGAASRQATGKSAAEPPASSSVKGDRVPFDRIRRMTAEHMVRSRATSAHVTQAVEVNFAGVDRVRLAQLDTWRAREGNSLTYLPFIARATCLALREFPRANSSVDGDALVLHPAVHLCIAVNLNFEGLVAPVIRNADALNVADLARAIQDIGDRARTGRLDPEEYFGGTYTVSNNGSYGTLMTTAIINQPQVAILSVDAISKKPVVVESPAGDVIAIRPVGVLAQSFDHRAIDGAYSAAFLQRVKALLEERDWSAEL